LKPFREKAIVSGWHGSEDLDMLKGRINNKPIKYKYF